MGMTFNLENIIGIDALDVPVRTVDKLSGDFSTLVLDPGKMVGWAGVCYDEYEERTASGSTGYVYVGDPYIEVGQAPWHDALRFKAERVVIERTPFASQRTFDTWPLYYTGAVIAKLYPRDVNFVLPTQLKVNQKWFKLPRGHGLGPHAKDALTHLVGVLVKDAR